MRVNQKISDAEVGTALNFLANNWKHDPTLRAAFSAVFEKLKAGSEEDQKNAQVLENYLLYPGSESAFKVVTNLHIALRTKDARRASGLPPKTKGAVYTTKLVKPGSDVLEQLVRFELGKTNKKVVYSVAEKFLGGPDRRTTERFIVKLRPIARKWADFHQFIMDARRSKRQL